MAKIRFLRSIPGSPDGIRVYHFEAGEECDRSDPRLSDDLLRVFHSMRDVFEIVKEVKPVVVVEDEDEDPESDDEAETEVEAEEAE